MAQKFSGLYSNPLRKVNHMLVYKVEIFLFEPLFLIICFQYYTVAQADQFCAQTLKALLGRKIIHFHFRCKFQFICQILLEP